MNRRSTLTAISLGIFSSPAMVGASPAGRAGIATSRDAVIRYDRDPLPLGAPREEIWYKRGDRVRIDRLPTDNPGALEQKFSRLGQKVAFTIMKTADGKLTHLSLLTDPLAALPTMKNRSFTGGTETHLGKRCRVWRVTQIERRISFAQSGCVTATGIELWWRQVDDRLFTAKSITYKPVVAKDVRPPVELFELRSWIPLVASGDHRGDYRVSLQSAAPYIDRFVRIQSGYWQSTRSTYWNGGSDYLLMRPDLGFTFRFIDNGKGRRNLSIDRRAPWREPATSRNRIKIEGNPDEMWLGTRCRWWNTMPGVSDAGRHECLTEDGIPLKSIKISQGSDMFIAATELRRSPQSLGSLMPAERISHPGFWEFE